MKITNHTFYGILKDGKIIPSNRKVFDQTLAQYEDSKIVITVKRDAKKRSLDQNAYYWGVVLRTISIDTGHTVDELHDILKAYIPNKKMIPFTRKDGKVVSVPTPRSTTELSTSEFSEYIERIRAKFAMDFGIIIPEAEGGKEKLNKDASEVINSAYNNDYDPSKCVI